MPLASKGEAFGNIPSSQDLLKALQHVQEILSEMLRLPALLVAQEGNVLTSQGGRVFATPFRSRVHYTFGGSSTYPLGPLPRVLVHV